jgi:restriction endonuclease S subunit
MGKTQKNVSPFDILNVKIPKLELDEQNELLHLIQPIETEIIALKNSKLKILDIINKVFGEEFGFDWEEFERRKKQKTYSSNLNEFANNIDCRMGLRFHNLAGKYLHSFLVSHTTKKVKDYIDEPIVLGKSVSPIDYDEDGEYFYIAMSNIKTYAFDPEDCKKVTDEYSKNNLRKTVQKGDILLARSGEGTIGKVALIEDEDLNAIFADFTQRIRLTNYNTLFAYYFFRREFFQYLVYTHKKGLGNNTNIFPSQIQEFPIPDWSDAKQTEIVEKIKTQIDAQNLIDHKIEMKQQEINNIIEEAIRI